MPVTRATPVGFFGNDVYTGLLAISFLAMVAGPVLMYAYFSRYPDARPAAVDFRK